jgi:hypothetical protein
MAVRWKGGWSGSPTASIVTYYEGDVVLYDNITYTVQQNISSIAIGSPAPPSDMSNWNVMVAGGSDGTSGSSGTSGLSGSSGTSGDSGSSGTSGVSGSSGSAGSSGSSGTSGVNGSSGSAGTSGTSFSSPYSGNLNGTAGQSWMSSYGATASINWNNGNVQTHTLAASTTFTFANPNNGATYIIVVKQAVAGNYVINWPSITWVGGLTPVMTATANKTDIYTFIYVGSIYYGSYSQNF